MTVHATCVALPDPSEPGCWAAVMLFGPSGCGKSDLALRLIDDGGRLIADDRVAVTLRDDVLIAAAPPSIAGLLEVRGMGVADIGPASQAAVRLAAEHRDTSLQERVPEARTWDAAGVAIPLVALDFAAASAPARVRVALRATRLGLFADVKARLDAE